MFMIISSFICDQQSFEPLIVSHLSEAEEKGYAYHMARREAVSRWLSHVAKRSDQSTTDSQVMHHVTKTSINSQVMSYTLTDASPHKLINSAIKTCIM